MVQHNRWRGRSRVHQPTPRAAAARPGGRGARSAARGASAASTVTVRDTIGSDASGLVHTELGAQPRDIGEAVSTKGARHRQPY